LQKKEYFQYGIFTGFEIALLEARVRRKDARMPGLLEARVRKKDARQFLELVGKWVEMLENK